MKQAQEMPDGGLPDGGEQTPEDAGVSDVGLDTGMTDMEQQAQRMPMRPTANPMLKSF